MSRARQNFTHEFPTFGFARAVRSLRNAWNAKLGKIDVQRATTLTAKEIYTGLYTLYANIIDVTDNGSGYAPVSPSRRLLTIGSSIWWERVGGGFFRCSWDMGRWGYSSDRTSHKIRGGGLSRTTASRGLFSFGPLT